MAVFLGDHVYTSPTKDKSCGSSLFDAYKETQRSITSVGISWMMNGVQIRLIKEIYVQKANWTSMEYLNVIRIVLNKEVL